MGWSLGYSREWSRDIGYGVIAFCDHPGCGKEIDRGLSHVCCGERPHGGERGCGLYFCEEHHRGSTSKDHGLCARCCPRVKRSFSPTFDHPTWILHKLTDESWKDWRDENPDEVKRLREQIPDTLSTHEMEARK